jgi:DNA-binding response OmpR family regulator
MSEKKVLIVDDEEPLRSLVRLYLEQERFHEMKRLTEEMPC